MYTYNTTCTVTRGTGIMPCLHLNAAVTSSFAAALDTRCLAAADRAATGRHNEGCPATTPAGCQTHLLRSPAPGLVHMPRCSRCAAVADTAFRAALISSEPSAALAAALQDTPQQCCDSSRGKLCQYSSTPLPQSLLLCHRLQLKNWLPLRKQQIAPVCAAASTSDSCS